MTLKTTLTQVFSTNFMAYLHSHIAHVNITGRNFQSDHALLGGIYEDLQDQIDHIGELLRTIQTFMPRDLDSIIEDSMIENHAVKGDADALLEHVYEDIETLIECYRELVVAADEEGAIEISNYAQDRLLALDKHCWMLRSTLGDTEEYEEDDDELY